VIAGSSSRHRGAKGFPYSRGRLSKHTGQQQLGTAVSPPLNLENKESHRMANIDRRMFMQWMGGAAALTTLKANIAKALEIPAHNAKGNIQDVEHVVILMQENRPFDHHFGALRGVRGFNDPRAASINLPLASGTGTTPASVFLQPAGAANESLGFAVPPNSGNLGGPANGADVIPPFRVNPNGANPGLTYLPGTDHSWEATHGCWNNGQYDSWAVTNGPMVMSYMTREDLPYHYALADAFTVGDAYFCSIMGPTNPNRMYLWSGCVGNVNYLGAGGTDGQGAGPATYNGLSVNNAYWVWNTFPEVLQAAGVSWKIYQDLAGQTFSPDFGDGTGNSFAGNFTDNPVLYFNQYATAATSSPLFQNGCTGTQIINQIPSGGATSQAWLAWADHLFDQFRSDVQGGTLPQVSWIVAPAGYTEHADWPIDYGAWYISQIFNILVSNPEVFSKTVFIVDYDEADGSFDHLIPPTPPQSAAYGASTVSIEDEIVTTSLPNGPIGLGTRVPFLVISPWSKGGYVTSEVFDHTSVIQFIEKRFGVTEANISPWRRAVTGDLTSVFNFVDPNHGFVNLPPTTSFLPPVDELAGGNVNTFTPTLSSVIVGKPAQEVGLRPSRALPYELHVHASVEAASSSVVLTFVNTGRATAVFQVRSGNPSDLVRSYTVEPGKELSDSWSVTGTYSLSVYGPNGFARFFNGSIGSGAAVLKVSAGYRRDGAGGLEWKVTNLAATGAEVTILDAYSGHSRTLHLRPEEKVEDELQLDRFFGWYDVVVTVAGDSTFKYEFAGHVETGRDSFSDPALGGLVTLKG
jgi:phospholipase C